MTADVDAYEQYRRAYVALRLRNLGLYAVADDFAAGRCDDAFVRDHIENYCWPNRDDSWSLAARFVLAHHLKPSEVSGA